MAEWELKINFWNSGVADYVARGTGRVPETAKKDFTVYCMFKPNGPESDYVFVFGKKPVFGGVRNPSEIVLPNDFIFEGKIPWRDGPPDLKYVLRYKVWASYGSWDSGERLGETEGECGRGGY